jgi:hypothetical protein
MTENDAERILREALAARATSAVGDGRPVPPFGVRSVLEPAGGRGSQRGHRAQRAPRRVAWLAPAAAAVLVAAVVVATSVVLHRGSTGGSGSVAAPAGPSSGSSASHSASVSSSASTAATTPVHI